MIHMWEYGGGLDTMVEVGARTECREYTYGLSVVTRADFLLIDKAKSIALNGELERAVGMKESPRHPTLTPVQRKGYREGRWG